MNIRKTDVCTASLALALALAPWTIAQAASHCKGLAENVCGTTTACKWQQAKNLGVLTKPDGSTKEMNRKAHCRLDVSAAAKLAADIGAKR